MGDDELRRISELLSKPENASALAEIIEALPTLRRAVGMLKQLEDMGALDTLFSMACAVANMRNMLSDEMVAGAASLGSNAIELLYTVSSPEVRPLMSAILDHGAELREEVAKAPRVSGITGLMRALRDPEVQEGLGSFMAMLKVFGRYSKAHDSKPADGAQP